MKTHARTACRARSPRRLTRTILPLALLATLIAATPAMAQNRNRPGNGGYGNGNGNGYGHGNGHRHNTPVYVEPCQQPTWREIQFDRGYEAGKRDGYANGLQDGRYRNPFCDTPTRRLKRKAQPFRRGYRKAYADAYADGFRRGNKPRHGRRGQQVRRRPRSRFSWVWSW